MLDKINSLTIRNFEYDPHYIKATQIQDRIYTGIIADEVEQVLPYCVREQKEQIFTYTRTKNDPTNLPLNQYCSVADEQEDATKEVVTMTIPNCKIFNADTINYMLVGAVQELKKTIDGLTARLEVLENP